MSRKILFTSYSHKDTEWFERIKERLEQDLKEDNVSFEIWYDRKIMDGSDWEVAIKKKLEGCNAAILIVTPDFVGSKFIMEVELPDLLKRKLENPSLKIIPIYTRPLSQTHLEKLGHMQLRGFFDKRSGVMKALSELEQHEQDKFLNKLSDDLRVFFNINCITKEKKPQPGGVDPQPPPIQELRPKVRLEISLRHRYGENYKVELQLSDTEHKERNRMLNYVTRISRSDLHSLRDSINDYADALERQTFPDGAPRKNLEVYQDQIGKRGTSFRVNIEATARDLHRIFWETLVLRYSKSHANPATTLPHIFVRSASAAGEDWPAPSLCAWPSPETVFGSLIPPNTPALQSLLTEWKSAFKSPKCEALEKPINLATFEKTDAKIMLLVLHFASIDLKPRIILQDGSGGSRSYSFKQFAKLIRESRNRPQMIIIDSLSEGGDSGHPVSVEKMSLLCASELITTGICAAVTLQAPMERKAWMQFIEEFIAALEHTGNLDVAASTARNSIEDYGDKWKPIVLTRLRAGQVWYMPGFKESESTDDPWDPLLERIRRDKLCVPIIGPQISKDVMRSREDIALKLADKYLYPGVCSDKRELRKVSQYVRCSKKDHRTPARDYRDAVVQHVFGQYPNELKEIAKDSPITEMSKAIWDSVLSKNENDPFKLLAKLQLPLYLTTNLHNYLSLALEAEYRKRHVEVMKSSRHTRDRIFSKKETIIGQTEEDRDNWTFKLDKSQPPLVYYLFGRLDQLETMILTEDDHFGFLLQFFNKWTILPSRVTDHISDSALLFLGFDLSDWEFRSVFRALLEIQGRDLILDNPHVAVQICVDDDTMTDPDRTQRYLEAYFKQIGISPQVFLGSAEDFLIQLNKKLEHEEAGEELERGESYEH